MNALMTIQIRVLSAQARTRIRELEAEVAMLRKQTNSASRAMNGMGAGGLPALVKWGNQVQWAGRQLMYNFTLPIVIAGAAATKFALDNQKALTRVIKVYGDNSEVMNNLAKVEIPALEKAFVALSNRFGVAQADAINIAADWAAAGASGSALAKSVGLTMETMVLGEMSAKDATEALISIQAQYGQSITELSQTIDTLNMVENQTGISMQGLVQGMARSAGVARTMGVDVTHLAAMMAALVPATGSATAAGNGLKTILSRLMSPTNEANQVMELMGINTKELAWQSLNATQRLEKMAAQYVKLDDAQKIVVASTAASRWQINRFGQLMTDINNPLGYYHRSLNTASDSTANFNQRVKELNTVLSSNPQRLKQIWVILQNTLAQIIQPLIPAILMFTRAVANMAKWFSELSPEAQKFGLALLVILAAVGPLARYIGAFSVLLGVLHASMGKLWKRVKQLGEALWWLVKTPFKLLWSFLGMLPAALGAVGTGLAAVGTMVSSAVSVIPTAVTQAMWLTQQAIVAGFVSIFGAIGSLRPALAGFMSRFYIFVFAVQSALAKTYAYLYVFFTVQIPAAISRAYAPIFAASIWLWGAIQTALAASGTAILAGVDYVFVSVVAWISRSYQAILAASTWAFSAITTGLVAAWAGVQAALVRLGALFAAGMAGIQRIFALGMGALPVIAARVGAMVEGIWLSVYLFMSRIGPLIIAALANPWTYVVIAVVALLIAFRDKLADVWNMIVSDTGVVGKALSDVFWSLPKVVRDSMIAVVRVVKAAVMKVYELFSYLNPFATHSPSLVNQVTKGMAIIRDQYGSVGNVGQIFAKAARDLALYKTAVDKIKGGPFSEERANVASYSKALLPLFDALVADLNALNAVLAKQAAAVAKQKAVVDSWSKALDDANRALDAEEVKLQSLQDNLDKLNTAYDEHKAAMEAYASAPLQGMGEMEDAIFANEQAQKSLRLEMMKWEDANGSIEDMQNNMAKLAGSIEQMKGEVQSLTAAGAGSDITGPMQAQIAQMQAAYDNMNQTVQNSPINDMQKELDRLARQGEEMDLEKSLKFDALQRQIEQLVNTSKELTFDEIVAGIKKEQDAMAALQPQIDAATKAVQDQQAAVDAAKASRDAVQATYDAESAKLDQLNAAYDKTEQAVRDIETALNDMGQAATDATAKAAKAASGASGYLTPGAQNFLNAKGGNFPDVSGSGAQIGREGTGPLTSQVPEIDKFTQDTIKQMEDLLGGLDMWAPIKEKWNEFKKWWEINVTRNWIRLTNGISENWNKLTGGIGASDTFATIKSAISDFTSLFTDDFQKIGKELGKVWDKLKTELGPELEKFKELWPDISKVLGFFWTIIKGVAGFIAGAVIGIIKVLTSILAHTLGPAIDLIIGVFKGLIKILRGVVEFITGIFTGNFSMMIDGIKNIFGGMIDAIWSILKNGWNLIWGLVEGFVNGVIDWIQWLYDKIVGHSIIPDMINAIIDWFKKLPGEVWEAIKSLVGKVVQVATDMWNGFTTKSAEMWESVKTWLGERAQAAWDALVGIKDKVGQVASDAWEAFKQANIDAWNTVTTWLKDRAQAAWDALISIKDKIAQVATDAWNAFIDREKRGWAKIFEWLKTRGQDAWNALISVKDKIADVASKAWDAFKSKSSEVWGTFITWAGGLAQAVWDKIILIKDKLKEAAKQAFEALVAKAKEIIDGKNGFMTWITGLPGRIAGLLGSIGTTVANAIKSAWNGVANWINDHGIAAVNKVTTHFGFTLGKLPTFEGGGVIPGRVSKKDNTIIAARTGEGVIVPELVRMLGGARGLNELNHAARQGSGAIAQLGIERFANGGVIGAAKSLGIKGYEDGGVIGMVTGWLKKGVGFALSEIIGAFKKPVEAILPDNSFAEKWTVGYLNDWRAKAREWGDQQEQMGNGIISPIGYKSMEAALTAHFGKNITFTSDYRSPSSNRQAGGSATSLHMQGRAVDMTPRKDIFDFIHNKYGNNTAELFWTPQNGRNIMGGKEVTIGGALAADHYDHIHWGYDKGGILPPGMTFARNATGRDEYTLTGSDWDTLSNVVSLMDRVTQKRTAAGAPGGAVVARMGGTLAVLERRLQAMDSQSSVTTHPSVENNTYNFYGDLEFPNITSGDDADEFIKNLKGLVG